MIGGFFNQGRQWQLDKDFRNLYGGSTLHVGLYTNARDSLTNRNVLADITACAGAGYAPISLSAAGWSTAIVLGGTPEQDAVTLERANVIFTATADWGVVRGAYLFDQSAGIAIAWRDAPYDYSLVNGAKYLVDWLSEAF